MMNIGTIKKDFPLLSRTIHGKPLVYLDNAATTQKPKSVLATLDDYYTQHNANIHRGVHTLAEEATTLYEDARKNVAAFIGAKKHELIFTRGTTESINLLSHTLGASFKKGDEVVTTIMEHHSNIIPWQVLRTQGVVVKFVDTTPDGKLMLDQYDTLITEKTKLVTVTHVSNVTGTVNDVKKIGSLAHKRGALFLVDGAQSTPHIPIDVKVMDADFFAFSGHKMLGPTGIGGFYGKSKLLDQLEPFQCGGGMIKSVTPEHTTWHDAPWKFEAGTPHIAGAVGLGAAVDYLRRMGMHKIHMHEQELLRDALEKLSAIKGIKLYGPADIKQRGAVVPFTFSSVHSHDVATIVDREGIAIRSGHHCAQPFVNRLGEEEVCRASFYLYNDTADIDKLVDALKKVQKIFGK